MDIADGNLVYQNKNFGYFSMLQVTFATFEIYQRIANCQYFRYATFGCKQKESHVTLTNLQFRKTTCTCTYKNTDSGTCTCVHLPLQAWFKSELTTGPCRNTCRWGYFMDEIFLFIEDLVFLFWPFPVI